MDDPSNYRGITLVSCISKVFASAISCRLYKFVENVDILGSEQAGFRKGHFTVDLIFALFEIYVKKRKSNLYRGFVDYSKAFDTMPRVHLWAKLLSQNINGKILDVIRNNLKCVIVAVYTVLK